MAAPRPAAIAALPSRLRAPQDDLPRLGVIALSTDLTFERDAARLIGWDEAAVHVARIPFENPTTPESLRALGPRIAGAAALLVPGAELAAVAFACTAASVTIRNAVVRDAVAGVRPGVPVLTPSAAGAAALKALGVRRIALLTPYLAETTAPMVGFFEAAGFSVVRAGCFGLADDRDMARLDPAALVEAAAALDGPEVDALFLSCTAMPSLAALPEIEARLGKPAVGSNQATLWAMRALAGLGPGPGGAGRLMGLPGPEAGAWR